MSDRTGSLPVLPGIFPDTFAPIVRNTVDGRELAMLRWGMPSPALALKNRKTDCGITNIRNTRSPHWKRWLDVEHRCLVPMTSFSKYDVRPDGSKEPVWFALDDTRPLAFFAGIWMRWNSVRKLKEGETTNDLFGFLTTDANGVVAPVHAKVNRASDDWKRPAAAIVRREGAVRHHVRRALRTRVEESASRTRFPTVPWPEGPSL